MFERISIDPKVCHGEACIKGTRIPVHLIVRYQVSGRKVLLKSRMRKNLKFGSVRGLIAVSRRGWL